MNRNVFFLVAVAVFCAVLCAGSLSAEVFDPENSAESLYGKGVHAFFDADYRNAVKFLSKVDDLDGADPRPYFFLGLAQVRLGQDDKAEKTFKKAAALEWSGRSVREFNVSDALKRIQGLERLRVEEFRRQAKLDAEQADRTRQQARYGQERVENKRSLAKLAEGSELPLPELNRFIGIAPFGARSVDPFRVSDEADNANVPSKKAQILKEPAKTEPKETKQDDENLSGASADEKKDKPADQAANSPAKAEKKEEKKDDDDDPFK